MKQFQNNKLLLRVMSVFVAISFLSNVIFPSFVHASDLTLPNPTQLVPLSDSYSFPMLKGMKFDPNNPLNMEFIIDTADKQKVSEEEASILIKYFLAGLTIPEDELWVNMSPYEADKMITPNLAQTDLGKDLLSQDYILKQLSSSLTYPETEVGKDFWLKTYQEVLKVAKTTNIPINTFNKLWIVPDKALIHQNGNFAFIKEAKLKAMLEEDYLALNNNIADIKKQNKGLKEELIQKVNLASSSVVRSIILPKITQEINSGKNFATLRQIYYSLVLGVWFKQRFKDSIYSYYINQAKVKGIDLQDKDAKDKIYNLYVEAFKKGVYNYSKTEKDLGTGKRLKRQYFSGGFDGIKIAQSVTASFSSSPMQRQDIKGIAARLGVNVTPQGMKAAASSGVNVNPLVRVDVNDTTTFVTYALKKVIPFKDVKEYTNLSELQGAIIDLQERLSGKEGIIIILSKYWIKAVYRHIGSLNLDANLEKLFSNLNGLINFKERLSPMYFNEDVSKLLDELHLTPVDPLNRPLAGPDMKSVLLRQLETDEDVRLKFSSASSPVKKVTALAAELRGMEFNVVGDIRYEKRGAEIKNLADKILDMLASKENIVVVKNKEGSLSILSVMLGSIRIDRIEKDVYFKLDGIESGKVATGQVKTLYRTGYNLPPTEEPLAKVDILVEPVAGSLTETSKENNPVNSPIFKIKFSANKFSKEGLIQDLKKLDGLLKGNEGNSEITFTLKWLEMIRDWPEVLYGFPDTDIWDFIFNFAKFIHLYLSKTAGSVSLKDKLNIANKLWLRHLEFIDKSGEIVPPHHAFYSYRFASEIKARGEVALRFSVAKSTVEKVRWAVESIPAMRVRLDTLALDTGSSVDEVIEALKTINEKRNDYKLQGDILIIPKATNDYFDFRPFTEEVQRLGATLQNFGLPEDATVIMQSARLTLEGLKFAAQVSNNAKIYKAKLEVRDNKFTFFTYDSKGNPVYPSPERPLVVQRNTSDSALVSSALQSNALRGGIDLEKITVDTTGAAASSPINVRSLNGIGFGGGLTFKITRLEEIKDFDSALSEFLEPTEKKQELAYSR